MTEKQYHVQRIYKGMDNGVKYYDWCVMKDDTVILRLSTRMDCKDVVEVLNELSEENEQLQTQLSQLAKSNREGVEKVQSLAKENEQLRTKNNAHLQDIEVYREENTHLKLENGQLKSYTGEMEDYLARLEEKNEQLRQPNCRNCIHFSCDNADIYCMKKEYESIPNCSIAKDCDEYEGMYE